jgi:Tfp pilus assembly protein PilW
VCEPQTTLTVTENVTLNNNHGAVILCGASGAITITLPAAASARKCPLTFINKSGNTVTIDANASETIDGSSTIQLASVRASATLLTDGTEWFIVSRVPSS